MRKKYYMAALIVYIAIVAGIAGLFLYQNISYRNRWYPGTAINGFSLSGETIESSLKKLQDYCNDYRLEILGRRDGKITIAGKDIGYGIEWNTAIENMFKSQHDSFLFPWNKGKNIDVGYTVHYDEKFLEEYLAESDIIKGSKSYVIVKPKSADIVYDEVQGHYICVEEEIGNSIKFDRFYEIIKKALNNGEKTVNITDGSEYPGIYEEPDITSDNSELQNELLIRNNAVVRFVHCDIGNGVTETITPKNINKWIDYKNGKIKYNEKKISEWVKDICQKYNTVGKVRKLKSHTGKSVSVIGGDYGWQLDYETILAQLRKILIKKIGAKKIESYITNPTKENKEAITTELKITYLNRAYKISNGKNVKDWDTKNYIEVSLSEQMVYVFRKGKVAFSCRCISGLPGERHTTTGTYYIKEHRTNYTMVGEDYETFVKYWVRITWTGIGFHPATWQPWSRWSNTLYKTKGSHGCINLEPADAEKIYNMARYMEAVFIYE